jgi:WD40 repeat protein
VIEHPYATAVDIALSPDGRRLVVGGLDGAARVFDARTGELLAVLAAHDERISGVAVSPDGTWALTTSWDHRAHRWALSVLDEPAPPPPASPTLEQALQATAR